MSEENICVDTFVTKDMTEKELFEYAKYLEYRKEELLNINSHLQEQLQQKENIIKEVRELLKNDYFEDGSFNNEYKVFELLDKGE